ncbi:MAG: hypothetical protein R2883_06195 [Caldisericia bacterium]
MDHKAEYDPINNILFLEYFGRPSTLEDVDFIIDKNEEEYFKISKKPWVIVDISGISITSPNIIKYYAQKSHASLSKHAIAGFSFTSKSLQRVMTQIYNTATGQKLKFFKTKEETIEHVLELQRETK